ncbi:MAG: 1-acyl-sn-glycerol-3-phosphate acyltransferase, partial [Clostridia bacterium]|nr:1-acyl-sn-glycerol-3-phosphate acyltransferase [Clostridia bacterium]
MKYVGFTLLGIFGAFLLYCLVLVVSSLFVDDSKEYDKPSRYYRFLLNSSTFIGLWILRVKIHVEGMENVPKDRRFMLVSNHRSNYDPFITLLGLKLKDAAFISKPENFKIPFFGKIARKCMYTAID